MPGQTGGPTPRERLLRQAMGGDHVRRALVVDICPSGPFLRRKAAEDASTRRGSPAHITFLEMAKPARRVSTARIEGTVIPSPLSSLQTTAQAHRLPR
jgi:hypothetical protein